MSTIIVIVSPQGDSNIETHGFAGSQCREASRFLEQALGAVTQEKLTSEFYATAQTESQQTRQQP
ncbi:DUF2997 domain-containing protein [Roseimaritima ulvae]|uniref:DUF2997 domain-containing protein n=1 Tax=Roseimaritima ulvae TaxID=980254 RepID=A0A5B9QVD3_9BACT|nr:DUF2997 domain-containing protein [Roseimaritima ulvae]QEG41335.1 hypothetical protein UC8_33540 [Roseimaritima ulvae]